MSTGLSVRLRSKDGWAVKNAILTVTDLGGQQAGRADGGEDGVAATGPLAPGTYTAIVMAPGYEPAARTVVVPLGGTATLGTVTLTRAAGGVELPPPGTWTIDPVHSAVTITARHLGMASVTGSIGDFSGTIEIGEPVEASTVRAVMRADSIDTGNKIRDDHLRSPDFLDVVSYPQIEYAGTSIAPDGSDRWTVEGSLTLHGTTKPVPLDLTYLGTSPDPWGGQRAAFRATAELRRKDFAMDWNQILPTGSVLVGWVMQITLDIEAVEGDLPPLPEG